MVICATEAIIISAPRGGAAGWHVLLLILYSVYQIQYRYRYSYEGTWYYWYLQVPWYLMDRWKKIILWVLQMS